MSGTVASHKRGYRSARRSTRSTNTSTAGATSTPMRWFVAVNATRKPTRTSNFGLRVSRRRSMSQLTRAVVRSATVYTFSFTFDWFQTVNAVALNAPARRTGRSFVQVASARSTTRNQLSATRIRDLLRRCRVRCECHRRAHPFLDNLGKPRVAFGTPSSPRRSEERRPPPIRTPPWRAPRPHPQSDLIRRRPGVAQAVSLPQASSQRSIRASPTPGRLPCSEPTSLAAAFRGFTRS